MREVAGDKNPADAMTKYLDGVKLWTSMKQLGLEVRPARSKLALELCRQKTD